MGVVCYGRRVYCLSVDCSDFGGPWYLQSVWYGQSGILSGGCGLQQGGCPSVRSFISAPFRAVTVWDLAYTANSVGIWPVWDFGWASVNSGLQHGPSFSSAML